jgi:hypothetical protein
MKYFIFGIAVGTFLGNVAASILWDVVYRIAEAV